MQNDFRATLPKCKPLRIVCHWTAGSPGPSDKELQHYHFCVDGQGRWIPGKHSIADNCRQPLGKSGYAAHVAGMNSFSIGIAVCGMANAKERPFDPGPFPFLHEQWLSMAKLAAVLCVHYGIPVTPQTVFQHWEAPTNKNGKWDVAVLPWNPRLPKKDVCDLFRAQVSEFIKADGRR